MTDLLAASSSSCVLGLFARWPEPGRVKTRLARDSSPTWAARVAEAFLRDLVERLAQIEARHVLAYAPPTEEASFAALVRDRFALWAQPEGHLGERMEGFFRGQMETGRERVVLVGSDSPTLPLDAITQAFQELRTADVVLGPATDGGYYLIGCARRVPAVFQNVDWSSPHVLADTITCLVNDVGRVAVLPPWYDVDTIQDWWMLRGHIMALRRAGHDPGVPHSERLLEKDPSMQS